MAVDRARKASDRGAESLADALKIDLGLELLPEELAQVTADLAEVGIAPGQILGVAPLLVDALDDHYGWSLRFDLDD